MEKQAQVKSLAARLCSVMAECKNIEKRGVNAFHKYKYVREADVSEALRELMASHGVFCLPDVEAVEERALQKGVFIRVKVKYTFINTEDPSDIYTATHYGDGTDTGDKGLYKALTGCHKYMLIRTFCVGSDDDPENESLPLQRTAQRATSKTEEPPPFGDDLPPPFEDVTQVFKYRVPFNLKDQVKPLPKDHGAKWNATEKVWDSPHAIHELDTYRVGVSYGEDEAFSQ